MKKSVSVFHWAPRVLCILAIMFISMFALDSFTPELTIWQQIGAFIMHLIPSLVLLIFLIVAWKWEYFGGIVFIVLGLGFSPFVFMHNYKMNHSIWMSLGIILTITFPFFVIGFLFIWSHKMKKRNLPKV